MSEATQINPFARQSSATVINSAVNNAPADTGTVLPGGYVLRERLNVNAGEADIFICEGARGICAAKLYRRRTAVKAEVIEALRSVNCPYVSPIYYSDVYCGMPFEILPYYSKGSLSGKKFTFEELKNRIIPQINTALAALHDVGIIHKDLKPPNIMLTDSGDIALIDFGISSVQGGSTVVVTGTGMTPEYSAPETFRGLFLEESDYYSFGITIYELFCGKSPYADMTAEEIARYTAIQKIPLPENMPQQLKALISAVTYFDITNRRNKHNPNRRWTYTEVDNWCRDIPQSLPGEGASAVVGEIPGYPFGNMRLNSVSELVRAFAEQWEEGKKQVFRGILSAFLKPCNPVLAGYAIDAEEQAARGIAPDVAFFNLLYRLSPETTAFFWRGKCFDSITALGDFMLDSLNKGENIDFIEQVFSNGLILMYVNAVCPENTALKEAAQRFEELLAAAGTDSHAMQLAIYSTAFVLAEDKSLRLDDMKFGTVDSLIKYLNSLFPNDWERYGYIFSEIFPQEQELSVQAEAWLRIQGKQDMVNAFLREGD